MGQFCLAMEDERKAGKKNPEVIIIAPLDSEVRAIVEQELKRLGACLFLLGYEGSLLSITNPKAVPRAEPRGR